MQNARDFRRIALGLSGAIESAHMGHPDFRVNGRIFASLNHDGTRGMVVLTPAQQESAVRGSPAVFEPESGAWGRSGCTRVHLQSADEEGLGEALTLAWQNIIAKPPSRPRSKTQQNAGDGRVARRRRASRRRVRADPDQ